MLPAERFLGSGHQTKETEIEANFLWQAATTPRPRRHVLHQASASFYERIQDTFLSQHYSCTNSYKSLKKKITRKLVSVLLTRAMTSGYYLLFSFVLSTCCRKPGAWRGSSHPGGACAWCWPPAASAPWDEGSTARPSMNPTAAPKMFFQCKVSALTPMEAQIKNEDSLGVGGVIK